MFIQENKEYELFGIIKEVNESLVETKSVIFELKDGDRVVLRLENDKDVEIGRIYHIKGVGIPYKNKTHILIKEYSKLTDDKTLDSEAKDKITNELMGYYMIEYKVCLNYIESKIENIENSIVKDITLTIYNKYKDNFMEYPAASKFHHPYRHGLLYHTYNALRLSEAYSDIYPHINKDLLFSGVILHDMMKVKEINEFKGEYTVSGKLLGHVSLIGAEIIKTATILGYEDTEEAMLLSHIVISHHDEAEFGSPKRPQIIEALIVHLCDVSDAKIEPTIEALETTKVGEYTEQINVNNRDKYYKHSLSK